MSECPPATVSQFGEQQLLKLLQSHCPAALVGDDAAVLRPQAGFLLVITTDMLVDGVHFSDRTTSPFDIGWRTAAANLSDLAAMGATPLGVTVALGLPPSLPVVKLEQIYQGMNACLQPWDTSIVGGDVCRSDRLTISMTALGQVLPAQQILRSTAQPGDAILVTGSHGGSRAGLELLLNPDWGAFLGESEREMLCRLHQRPQPRLDVPPLLRQHYPDLRVAGMDSSDGLADAVLQICRASDVGAVLRCDRIPIPDTLQRLDPEQALYWSLYGGEDFELVLCLPSTAAKRLAQTLGGDALVIGQVVEGRNVQLVDATGATIDPALSLGKGFQHFSPTTPD